LEDPEKEKIIGKSKIGKRKKSHNHMESRIRMRKEYT